MITNGYERFSSDEIKGGENPQAQLWKRIRFFKNVWWCHKSKKERKRYC